MARAGMLRPGGPLISSTSEMTSEEKGLENEEVTLEEDEEEWTGSGLSLLDYERDVLADTLPNSELFIVANGLGIERLFLEHLVLFSDRRLLAIVLNTSQHDENFLISKLKELKVGCEPKIINADVSTKDRTAIYLEGGVHFCSTRVALVDLLQSRLPVERVAVIFVYRAHNVLTSFQESFVLRLYREKKRDGLVKAFTDLPSAVSSLGQLQRLVDRLYVKHVHLMPRFSVAIEEELSANQLRSALFSVDVSASMRRVHRTLLDLIKVCVKDLRACSTTARQAQSEPLEEITHVPWVTTALERKLREKRSFLTDKQSRLLHDTSVLRDLLQMAENLDAATLLSKLLQMKGDKQTVEESSGWLMTPTAARMIEDLHELCGGFTAGKATSTFTKFITPAKWDVLAEILSEVKQIPVHQKELPEHGPSVLIIANTEEVCRQLFDVIRHGVQKAKFLCWRQLGRSSGSMPADEPLWRQENVSVLVRAQLGLKPETRNELVADVQKTQKNVARATQKKRKAVEDLKGTDSRIQTTIVQFGILHYKRRKTETKISEVSM
ncbi:unnamed protein product [Caenorhabditis auriculariae]|uniref:DNA repair endonuclease XPF n=1 Tax=Caenorhabditis auriculariae TaxID=2777116 RepID=A0A8S1HAU7_9PELO|nr:unnamed protein product [Caenorhabditis auriculariae]